MEVTGIPDLVPESTSRAGVGGRRKCESTWPMRQVEGSEGSGGREGPGPEGRLPAKGSQVESHVSHDTLHFQKMRKL